MSLYNIIYDLLNTTQLCLFQSWIKITCIYNNQIWFCFNNIIQINTIKYIIDKKNTGLIYSIICKLANYVGIIIVKKT